jgi:Tfp pilus assembly major pilin PilA
MNSIMKNANGFTLIEAVVSLAAFLIVTLAAINLNAYAATTVERIQVRAELLENARIAIDMMSTHLKAAERVSIVDGRRGIFEMVTRIRAAGGAIDERVFTYNFTAPSTNEAHYQRINFGRNYSELASYIAWVAVRLDGDIVTLTVETTDSIRGSSITVEPVRLTTKIKIYNTANLIFRS